MFCPSCGKDIPDHSSFCLGCGKAVPNGQTTAKSDRGKTAPSGSRNYMLGLLFLLGVGVIVAVIVNHLSDTASPTGSGLSALSKPILEGQIAVGPGQFQYWRFEVAPSMLTPRVIGSFHALGGSGNDIEAIVAEWGECENWLNGHQAQVQYGSGKVTNGSINVALREAGSYCLAFSNKIALVSGKTVTGNVMLRYSLR